MQGKVLALVGCGTIGRALLERVRGRIGGTLSGILLYDIDPEKSKALAKETKGSSLARDMRSAVVRSDIVVEAADPGAAGEMLELAVESRKDVMILSVGGMIGKEELLLKAAKAGIAVIFPSGAIGGLDAIRAARIAGIDSVTLTTMKHPKSLKGAPYIVEKGIDIGTIDSETVIFEGSVTDAVRAFPKNINVSAALALAGIGPEKTRVRIVSSPEFSRNIHEIRVESKAGTFTFRTENVPFPSNPKTSYLAALSAMAALEEYLDSFPQKNTA